MHMLYLVFSLKVLKQKKSLILFYICLLRERWYLCVLACAQINPHFTEKLAMHTGMGTKVPKSILCLCCSALETGRCT